MFPPLVLLHLLQRFTNEDHLAVHKHKHEMTLKFGPARTDSVIIAGTFFEHVVYTQRLVQPKAQKNMMLSLPADNTCSRARSELLVNYSSKLFTT